MKDPLEALKLAVEALHVDEDDINILSLTWDENNEVWSCSVMLESQSHMDPRDQRLEIGKDGVKFIENA